MELVRNIKQRKLSLKSKRLTSKSIDQSYLLTMTLMRLHSVLVSIIKDEIENETRADILV